jgi:hypothetical protein
MGLVGIYSAAREVQAEQAAASQKGIEATAHQQPLGRGWRRSRGWGARTSRSGARGQYPPCLKVPWAAQSVPGRGRTTSAGGPLGSPLHITTCRDVLEPRVAAGTPRGRANSRRRPQSTITIALQVHTCTLLPVDLWASVGQPVSYIHAGLGPAVCFPTPTAIYAVYPRLAEMASLYTYVYAQSEVVSQAIVCCESDPSQHREPPHHYVPWIPVACWPPVTFHPVFPIYLSACIPD